MIMIWSKKILLVAIIAMLAIVSLPYVDTYALGPAQTVTPPPPGQVSIDKLQQIWATEQAAYGKLGKLSTDSAGRISKLQDFINKAKAKGLDVSSLQSALDAFSAAVKQAQTLYQSGQGTISSHPGFDNAGKVMDAKAAAQTVKAVMDNLKQIREILAAPTKALKVAFAAFRQANKPTSTPTPTPNGG
jgi:enamine deaminase RidA (YjgF/YER057c/UK114 family)